MKSILNFICHY